MDQQFPWLLVLIPGVIIVTAAGYFIFRFLRGKIKIYMPKTAYNSGDTISGSFDLMTKKNITGNRLVASLVGYQKTTRMRKGERVQSTEEIYRNDTLIEESRIYTAGYNSRYEFEIDTIKERKPKNKAEKLLNSELAKTALTAVSFFSNHIQNRKIEWTVEIKLDAKGIDLIAKQPVSIQMMNINTI